MGIHRGLKCAVLGTAVALVGVTGCSSDAQHKDIHATLSVAPKTAVADVPVAVKIRGLPAGETVTVTSTAKGKVRWTASAKFTVPTNGVVSLGMRSKAGSYTGTNPMGLFEYMSPPESSDLKAFLPYFSKKSFTVKLQAKMNGRVVGAATVERLATAPGVTSKKLRPASDGVYGELFLPPRRSERKPALLLLGGSEGGLSMARDAGRIASHGYPVLALAYFHEPGLPKQLRDIPLEYFVKALHVLRSQPGVASKHVLVMGVSRGSEAALLLGAHFPKLVNGVIAGSPSSVVNVSTDGKHAAWTLHGKALPWFPSERYGIGDIDAPDTADAQIPVEDIQGPVMLVCGAADTVWPSCTYQSAIVKRLRSHHFAHPVTELRYPEAGHTVGAMVPYYSATAESFRSLGGTLGANLAGAADAHAALLKFLARRR